MPEGFRIGATSLQRALRLYANYGPQRVLKVRSRFVTLRHPVREN